MRAIFMKHRPKKPEKKSQILPEPKGPRVVQMYSKGKLTPDVREILSRVFQENDK